jgi:hypothetical protein
VTTQADTAALTTAAVTDALTDPPLTTTGTPMTREEQIAAFIAKKGVTKCAPSDQPAPSLRQLRRAREQSLLHDHDHVDDGDHEVQEMERGAQARYLEIQGVRE